MLGHALDSRYLLEEQVGAGGMGTVYRARDLVNQTPVAVKILHPERALDADRAAREAEVLAHLDAPGVVRYLGHGLAGATRYLVTEWIPGGTLAARLLGEGTNAAEAVAVTRRIAEILAPLHRAGVVHRDVKPSNVLLAGGVLEDVRLIDFGLAWRAELSRLTRTGTLIGTPGYMAPEQVRGERNLDPRIDVFALGCLLYECATGRPAFIGGDVTAVHAKILLSQPPREILPAPLAGVVDRMLAKDPDARLADAGEVAAALAAITITDPGPRRRRPGDVLTPPTDVALTSPGSDLFWMVLAMTDPDDPLDEGLLRAAAAAHGATIDVLPEGAIIASPRAAGSPPVAAARAARLAMAVRALVVDAPVVVVSGAGEVTGPAVVDGLLERGLRVLESSALAGLAGDTQPEILLDERTASLLGPEFVVQGSRLIPPASPAA